MIKELVSIFHENTPQIVQAIGEAVERRDASALAAHAHKLFSSLGAKIYAAPDDFVSAPDDLSFLEAEPARASMPGAVS